MKTSTPTKQILIFTNLKFPNSKQTKTTLKDVLPVLLDLSQGLTVAHSEVWLLARLLGLFQTDTCHIKHYKPTTDHYRWGDKDQISIIQNEDVSWFATYGYNREWKNIPCKAFG